jgi:putative transposase
MARLARVSLVDIPQHIILRYNNRQVCFVHYIDMKAYLHWLKLFSKKYQVGQLQINKIPV